MNTDERSARVDQRPIPLAVLQPGIVVHYATACDPAIRAKDIAAPPVAILRCGLRPLRGRPVEAGAIPSSQISTRVVYALIEVEHDVIRR
jgi:hypothetical protein